MIEEIFFLSFVSSLLSIYINFIMQKGFVLRPYYVFLKLFTYYYSIKISEKSLSRAKEYIKSRGFTLLRFLFTRKRESDNKTVVELDRKVQPLYKYFIYHAFGGCIYCSNFYLTLLLSFILLNYPLIVYLLIFMTSVALNNILIKIYFRYINR